MLHIITVNFSYRIIMFFEKFLDKFVSNLIVFISYTLVVVFWFYCYYILKLGDKFLLFYLPYGIIVLSILFFNIKIIFGLALTHIIFYLILINYNLELPYNNYFTLSFSKLICVPITLLVFSKFNISIGPGKNYRLDKTNIYNLLIITFSSTFILGILLTFCSLFFYNETNIYIFTVGNLIGAVILIISMKVLIYIAMALKSFIKSN